MSWIFFLEEFANPLDNIVSICERGKEQGRTSKHDIIIPQAGAIFAVRGKIPANNADIPSVRTICASSGKLAVEVCIEAAVEVITNACRLVLSTSKGDVINAALVPLTAPLRNATHAPPIPRRLNTFFQPS
jgi:hypothetical protein